MEQTGEKMRIKDWNRFGAALLSLAIGVILILFGFLYHYKILIAIGWSLIGFSIAAFGASTTWQVPLS